MAPIGHFDKKDCTNRQPGELATHYWGWVVVEGKLRPVRLTAKGMLAAVKVAENNIGDCPKAPGKMEEWLDQLATGTDIKR